MLKVNHRTKKKKKNPIILNNMIQHRKSYFFKIYKFNAIAHNAQMICSRTWQSDSWEIL